MDKVIQFLFSGSMALVYWVCATIFLNGPRPGLGAGRAEPKTQDWVSEVGGRAGAGAGARVDSAGSALEPATSSWTRDQPQNLSQAQWQDTAERRKQEQRGKRKHENINENNFLWYLQMGVYYKGFSRAFVAFISSCPCCVMIDECQPKCNSLAVKPVSLLQN